ncbi:hypothetical protein CCP2SC5_270016 [Azospirillaceae bacterium]
MREVIAFTIELKREDAFPPSLFS